MTLKITLTTLLNVLKKQTIKTFRLIQKLGYVSDKTETPVLGTEAMVAMTTTRRLIHKQLTGK